MSSYTLKDFHYSLTGPDQGDQVPLVFLHGLLGFSANWRRIAKEFETTRKVLVYDQRGHGRSVQPIEGYSPFDYAADLLNILNELKWQKVHLVGHSMGGRNALAFASLHPNRLQSLVLEDIGPISQPKALNFYKNLIQEVPVPFASRFEAKKYFDQRYQGQVMGAFLYSNLKEVPNVGASSAAEIPMDWKFSKTGLLESVLQGHQLNFWPQWESLKLPSLVIRGERSEDLPQGVFEEMLQHNLMAQGFVVADAGHWVHFEKPEEFTLLLKNFFAGL